MARESYFKTLCDTPEGRAKRKEWSTKPRKNAGRPVGVPDGHTRETIAPIRAAAKVYAKKVADVMAEKFNIEDEYQKEALQTAVEVMRIDGQAREKLAAARLVLDFTKSKPVSKSDVTLSAAEDFLAQVMADEETPVESTNEEDQEETEN